MPIVETIVVMLIFTYGGSSGRLMPPAVVEFSNMQSCESAKATLEETAKTVYCIDTGKTVSKWR